MKYAKMRKTFKEKNGMTFLKKGIADCKIVIPRTAHTVEKTAAEELAKYIEKFFTNLYYIIN